MNYILINKKEDLDKYIEILKNSKALAIDTEFNRSNKYYPELSLLQICYEKHHAIIIDCIAIENLNPIFDLIYDEHIIKIFHSCNQDLEIFYYKKQYLPKNIFDTQIACLMLNYQKDISYEKMVKTLLNVDIDKHLRTSNWSSRPLSKAQIKYGAFDVLYLYDCYEIIMNALDDTNKLELLNNIFKKLEDPKRYLPKLEQQANKIITPEHKDDQKLVISLLVAWRDNMAKQINIAKGLLLSNDKIKELADLVNVTKENITQILSSDSLEVYSDELYDLIQSSYNEKKHYPILTETQDTSATKNNIYHLLKIILSTIAKQHNLNEHMVASIITNQEELKQVAISQDIAIYKDWRYPLFGKTLEDFFSGKVVIKMIQDNITLEYVN